MKALIHYKNLSVEPTIQENILYLLSELKAVSAQQIVALLNIENEISSKQVKQLLSQLLSIDLIQEAWLNNQENCYVLSQLGAELIDSPYPLASANSSHFPCCLRCNEILIQLMQINQKYHKDYLIESQQNHDFSETDLSPTFSVHSFEPNHTNYFKVVFSTETKPNKDKLECFLKQLALDTTHSLFFICENQITQESIVQIINEFISLPDIVINQIHVGLLHDFKVDYLKFIEQ